MIKLIQVTNPMLPTVGQITRELVCESDRTLDLYLIEVLPENLHVTVSLNGHVYPPELWPSIIPCDGDTIVVAPRVAGGSVLRSLAALAVVAVATVVSGGLATGPLAALGGGVLGSAFSAIGLGGISAFGASLIAGAVAIGGNLLVSALSSKPPAAQQSPSYAFGGPQMTAQSGSVIPKGYGTMRWAGNCISSFVDVEGTEQYINALVCFGFGPARSIGSIQINGKDIETYTGVQYWVRYGTNAQLPIGSFNRIVNGYPQDTQCLAQQPVVVPGTGTLTQILQVDIQFPDGLFVLTGDGNYIPLLIIYYVEYSVSGANNWQPIIQPSITNPIITYNSEGLPNPYSTWCVVATDMPPNSGIVYDMDDGPHNPGDPWSGNKTVTTERADGSSGTYTKTFYGEWQPTNPNLNQINVSTWTDGFIGNSQFGTQPLYQRTSIYGLTPGKYDVRVTKYGSARLGNSVNPGDNNSPNYGQEMWIHSVNEISLLDLSYPNMILVGIRALATNQIGGSTINLTALIRHGLRSLDNNILPSALQAFEEDNPACVDADMMLDGLYGGGQWPGITAANINRFIDEWVAWAELNDTLVPDGNGNNIRLHVFNGVFDAQTDLWRAMGKVSRMSRAAVIPIGRDYGVFVENTDVPVQLFTMGNILDDSFTESWMDIDSRANQVEIEFADSTRFYKKDNPIVYMDPTQQNAGVAIKNVRIDGFGITVPAQAWHLARFKQLQNEYLLRTGTFKCDFDAVAARPGNLVILQHDVPQWGWGGRTLPGSTASVINLDRNDITFGPTPPPVIGYAGGIVHESGYSLIVLHPAVERYTGTVSAAAVITDGTGAVTGTQLTLSSFDNENRVTRCVIGSADSPILSAAGGTVLIAPVPGFTPVAGMAYQLFDTDVLETSGVVNLVPNAVDGMPALVLSTPLSIVPQDFSTYFYGPSGSQKIVRIVSIKKASEFRASIDWIDYNPTIYSVATPVIGETSAQVTSNPGVTSLTGAENVVLKSGSYLSYLNLAWANGPDTVGVGIYQKLVGGTAATNPGTPQLVARLTNATSWSTQIDPGVTYIFTVVGFDVNNVYAAIKTAPSVAVDFAGVTENLLLGSNFTTGFTFWSVNPRGGDALAFDLSNDGEATYTVAGSTLTNPQQLLYQTIAPAEWSVGEYLLLSGYLMDTAIAATTAPNVGSIALTLTFFNAGGAVISSATASAPMSGLNPTLTRASTVATQIPAGTAQVQVAIAVANPSSGTLSIPVGSVLTFSHLLLEIATSTQTLPSEWAAIDAAGQVTDLFAGSSSGLRAQGSLLPSFTGAFIVTSNATTGASTASVTIGWEGLVILWPDGLYTYIQNGNFTVSGLAAGSTYLVYPYFDVVNSVVAFVIPASTIAVGTPAVATAAYDTLSDAATRQDGRVPLASGGLSVSTDVGYSGTGGGGTGTGGSGGHPVQPLNPPETYDY